MIKKGGSNQEPQPIRQKLLMGRSKGGDRHADLIPHQQGVKDMIRDLSDEESRKAMKDAVERAAKEVEKLTEQELEVNATAQTGACCLYTYGVSSCTGGMTYDSCRKAAANTGTMFKWTSGKSCSQVSCP